MCACLLYFNLLFMRNIDVSGTHTAIITPMRNSQVDTLALDNLIESQINWGVNSIVAVGTTWESPTLSPTEHLDVIRRTVDTVKWRCLVLWWTGSNSTEEAISYTTEAEEAWVDGALIVAPYYNKPTQEWLYRHYREIARNTQLPIVLYSIPWRCGIEIQIDTVIRLARDCPNIIAIKEAWWSVDRVRNMRCALDRAWFNEFQILCWDDWLTVPFMSVWASWVISVASNLIPRQVVQIVDDMRTWNLSRATETALRYNQLFNDLFIETNPVPAKTALEVMYPEIYTSEVRLPLCEMMESNRAKLLDTMRNVWLI